MARRPSLAGRVQRRLAALYGVEAPHVDAFVVASEDGREVLEVLEVDGTLELRLYLPAAATRGEAVSLDVFCQVAEGVSHFVFLAERARRELPTTQLELELQAEVDKFVVLCAATLPGERGAARRAHMRAMHERLYGDVTFLHPPGSEPGERYRTANRLAARFVRSLEDHLAAERWDALARALRPFFEGGQRDKIEMARAA